MHEKGVVDDLIKKILTLSNNQKVVRVSVLLGALSHMSKGHFKEHFDMASAGTPLENVELEIEESEDINDPNAQSVLLKRIDILE